jgi:hypothetical protein
MSKRDARRRWRAPALCLLLGCAGSSPSPSSGGEEVSCPDGTTNAGRTIRTVNCRTVVGYDGEDLQASIDIPGLVQAGVQSAEKVLREVDDAATDSQLQFTQSCELYNACNLTSEAFGAQLDETQRHFRAIREKVELLKAGQGNPAVLRDTLTELYTSTVPPSVQAQESLAAELVLQAKRRGSPGTETLRDGARLRTGDQIVFGLRVSQPAYAYVFQRKGPSRTVDVLFPNPALTTLANPIPSGELVRIPPAGAVFTLDANDLGKEEVFFAVSKVPLPDLQSALAPTASNAPQQPAGVDKAMTDLFAQAVPECSDGGRGLTVASQACDTPSRGLTLAAAQSDPFFAPDSSLRAKTAPGDGVILKSFTFHHDP